MKAPHFFISLFLLPFCLNAQTSFPLGEVWESSLFFPGSAEGFHSLKDGKHYLELEEALIKHHFEKERAVDTFRFSFGSQALLPESYELSPNEDRVLLGSDIESIYRYSSKGRYYWANLAEGRAQPIANNKPISHPSFSPDNRHLVYQFENNLYLKNLSDATERAITTDGEKNAIIHGSGDWVYEEEFTLVKAFDFSADGRWLAWLRFDERNVPEFHMPMFKGNLYPEDVRFKYPKVGQPNSRVELMLCEMPEGQPKRISLPLHLEYAPRLLWNNQGQLYLMGLNRLQNHLWLYLVNPNDATLKLVYEDSSNTYLEIPDPIQMLPDSKEFIIPSERSGFKHLYKVNPETGQHIQLTSGNWEVQEVLGYHARTKTLFYTSTEYSAIEPKVYALDAKGQRRMFVETPGQQTAELCGDYVVFTHSEAHKPYRSDLYSVRGKKHKNLVDNSDFEAEYSKRGLSKPEFIQVPGSDGSVLNAFVIKPSDFSPNKQYGLLMYVYGGPGSQEVLNGWMGPNYGWFQYLASQGILVACVDNRGTGGRGKAFRDVTYGRLGEIETADQLAAVDWFAKQPWVDASRIGYFGWSYGGYMSALCLLKGKGKVAAAISVAPVSNWKFYDNIYTERYMGTLQTNPKGFDAQSPISLAADLKGAFLLIHGSGDDNVHWQNAAELSSALIKENKDFEQFIYPDKNHGIYGGYTRSHLYRKMTGFLMKQIGGKPTE
jgi:dipeptidyl-peptidase 4